MGLRAFGLQGLGFRVRASGFRAFGCLRWSLDSGSDLRKDSTVLLRLPGAWSLRYRAAARLLRGLPALPSKSEAAETKSIKSNTS